MHLAQSAPALRGHAAHVLVSLALVLTLAGAAFGELVQHARARPRRSLERTGPLRAMAAAGAAGSMVHFVVAPEHFREAAVYGTFFAIVAASQLGYSVLLICRPSSALVVAGMAANLCLLALWLCTRLVAVPFGPAAGATESFGALDVVASATELVAVVAAALALRAHARTRRQPSAVMSALTPL